LLEYAVTQYYEEYLEVIDHVVDSNQEAIEILQKLIEAMIQYKTEHFQLTAFIHRELSLDSTFVKKAVNWICSVLYCIIAFPINCLYSSGVIFRLYVCSRDVCYIFS